jgi:mannose-6-phosphate isomerase-like protein (cupin superfamily)/hemerythrin-like domain-containing protein
MPVGGAADRAVDLAGIASAERGLGTVWTQEGSEDLNVNLVRFEAGEGVGIHRNDEVDVVFVGVSGSGTVVVNGEKVPLEPGRMVYVPKGNLRATRSANSDFAYLTVHRRRGPVRLAPRGGTRGRDRRTQNHRKEAERMKRHSSLRKLSDDHHGGLVQARHLRRAAAGEGEPPAEVARAFLRFWEKDTSPHFREEEEVLLAVYARYGGDLDAEPIQEMVADHARIRGLVMTLIEEDRSGQVSTDTLRKIGERLEAHIRLEERRVFPLMESFLSERGLDEIGARLSTE